jgi:hypothetical protein
MKSTLLRGWDVTYGGLGGETSPFHNNSYKELTMENKGILQLNIRKVPSN